MATKSRIGKPRSGLKPPGATLSKLPTKSGIPSQNASGNRNNNYRRLPLPTLEAKDKKLQSTEQKENEVLVDCNENEPPRNIKTLSKFSYGRLKMQSRQMGVEKMCNNDYNRPDGVLNGIESTINTKTDISKEKSLTPSINDRLKAKSDQETQATSSHRQNRSLKFNSAMKGIKSNSKTKLNEVGDLKDGRKIYMEAKKQLVFTKDTKSNKKLGSPKIAKPVARPPKKIQSDLLEPNHETSDEPEAPTPDEQDRLAEMGRLSSNTNLVRNESVDESNHANDHMEIAQQHPLSSCSETNFRLRKLRFSTEENGINEMNSYEETCESVSEMISESESTDLPLSLPSDNVDLKENSTSIPNHDAAETSQSNMASNHKNNLLENKRKSRLKNLPAESFSQAMEETRGFKTMLLTLYKELKNEEAEKDLLRKQVNKLQSHDVGMVQQSNYDDIIGLRNTVQELTKENTEQSLEINKLQNIVADLNDRNTELQERILHLESQLQNVPMKSDASTTTNINGDKICEITTTLNQLQLQFESLF